MRRCPLVACFLVWIFWFGVAARAAEKESTAGVVVDKNKGTVTVDAKIAPRKMEDPKYGGVIYPIEVIACWGYPKGEKAHETVVTIDVNPSEVHKGLEQLGLKPGQPVVGESKDPPQGPEVNLYLEVPGPGGKAHRVSIEKTMIDPKTNTYMPKVKWRFTGSVIDKRDPTKEETVYGADLTGTLIAVFPVTGKTVLQTSLTMKDEKYLKLETNPKILPPVGTPVKLILEVPKKPG